MFKKLCVYVKDVPTKYTSINVFEDDINKREVVSSRISKYTISFKFHIPEPHTYFFVCVSGQARK